MQKKIIICLMLLILVINVVILTNPIKENKAIKNNDLISMNLQDEEGNYYETKNINFNEEGYHYNKRKSNCEGGSELNWQDGKLQVITDKTDKCHVYLDNNNFVEDLSSNGNHGKINSITTWDSNGLETASNNNYIPLKNNEVGNEVTLIAKIKATNVDKLYMDILGAGVSYGTNQTCLILTMSFANGNLQPYFQVGVGSSHGYAISQNSIEITSFYTLVGVYDNRQLSLYIDGALVANDLLSYNRVIDDGIFYFGGGITYSDILIFNRALTAKEIARDYANEINPTNKQNLLLWYKFD